MWYQVSFHTCNAAIEGDKLSSSCYGWRVWWVNMSPTYPTSSSPADIARAPFYDRPSTVGLVVNFFPAVRVVRADNIADMVGSAPRFPTPTHPTEIMVRLYNALPVESGRHSQKVLDLLDLAVSKDLIRE